MRSRWCCRVNLALFSTLALSSASISCFDDTPAPDKPIDRPTSMTQQISAAGGAIEIQSATFTFPPGAVSTNVPITCGIVDEDLPARYRTLSPVVRCEPSGLEFSEPVSVLMRPSAETANAAIYWSERDGDDLDRVATTRTGEELRADIYHFSRGAVAEESEDCDSNINNCGACNNVCSSQNGTPACQAPGAISVGHFRTQTQGGWGARANGGNPGSYRDAHFAAAFPNGVTIGCGSNTLTFGTALAVEDYLPAGGNAPFGGVLSGQALALALSVGFDASDPSFGTSSHALADLVATEGRCLGMSVRDILGAANAVLGGCAASFTSSQINTCATAINENFDDGTRDRHYLAHASSCEITCNAGYGDCNGPAREDGCEANLRANASHCGACDNVCGARSTCELRSGGSASLAADYSCVCEAGYTRVNGTCVDIDECTTGTDTCDANAACSNTPGGHFCTCADGFTGDGFSCEDQDECWLGLEVCDPNATCANSAGSYLCTCDPGYTGDGFSCSDQDECSLGTDNCDGHANCSNTIPGFSCACHSGYTGDGVTCADANECTLGTHNCSNAAACTNSAGSFSCACLPGYSGNGVTCTDVDECAAGTHGCQANSSCSNRDGGFDCTCNGGFASSQGACVDINECTLGSATCSSAATCTNTVGAYTCACRDGYAGNGVTCTDVDECALGTDACDANADCINVAGNYRCECQGGYAGSGFVCEDEDECLTGTDECAASAECLNTAGAYLCTCPPTYTGNGFTCLGPDECALGTDACDVNSTCTNSDESYTCACNAGYEGTGLACADVNECVRGSDTCSDNGVCTNTVGSFSCACGSGYRGDGTTCTDIDECTEGSGTCPAGRTCSNTPGAFSCVCAAGYRADGDNCVDVNECALGTHACNAEASCANTSGAYTCACRSGFTGDGRTCTDRDECALGTATCSAHSACVNASGSYSCACEQGFVGDGSTTCTDKDECLLGLDTCADGVTCTNTPGSYACGACPSGTSGEGHTCTDNNECVLATDDCGDGAGAMCQNTAGSFSCGCLAGYRGDGHTCTDIDECAEDTDGCSQNENCSNSAGGFACNCVSNCSSVNECTDGTDRCADQATCTDAAVGYTCACAAGYQGDGFVCSDVDECSLGSDNCDALATCANTAGSYSCTCPSGYLGDGTICTPLNECDEGSNVCSLDATCVDTPAGYTCECLAGYTGDGITCTDIDECATGQAGCSQVATCANAPGSFECICNAGYSGDGTTCGNIDECLTGADDCSADGTCQDTTPSFTCACNAGYTGNGRTCADVDECTAGTDNCHASAACTNTAGAFTCACNAGYHGDGVACTDIDECAEDTDDCSSYAACANTAGSFACTCRDGYIGSGRYCSEIATRAVEIAAGGGHTCARLDTGALRCWGWGIYGELGYGNTTDVGDNEQPSTARNVDIGGSIVGVAAGPTHTCAVLTSGRLRCFGHNLYGALGYGHTSDIGDDELPSSAGDVNVGGTVTQVAAGGEHTCALLSTGAVRCFGLAVNGQLGYANTRHIGDNETPATAGNVSLGGTAIQVVAGRDHTCALLSTGSVRCWGRGAWGQTGAGSTQNIGDNETPASVSTVNLGGTATRLAAGWYHTCAVLSTGAVRCFGHGALGQLGYGNTNTIGDNESPASAGDINLGGSAVDVTAGAYHSCARLTTGAVRCWGYGTYGIQGHGNTQNIGDNESPASVGDIALGGTTTQVAAGSYHTCAIVTPGRVRCWGRGENGRLGYGDAVSPATPEDIGDDELPEAAGDVPLLLDENECLTGNDSCDTNATCRDQQGGFACTCLSGFDGNGTTCTDVDECVLGTHQCGAHSTCVNSVGGHQCRCDTGYENAGTACVDRNECTDGSAGCNVNATCANTDGSFTCTCGSGYAGNGTTCADVNECSAGTDDCDANATCVNTAGSYTCGCNAGFFGDGQVCEQNRFVQIETGQAHTCGVLLNGGLRCWGRNRNGQLGLGSTASIGDNELPSTTANVNVGGNVLHVTLGDAHTCALLDTGSVRCWGLGTEGRLGYANTRTIGDNESPASAGDLVLGGAALQIDAGATHTCALLQGGTVRCWGNGDFGQLGRGDTYAIGDNETPVASTVGLGGAATAITAGGNHACAVLAGGVLRCWGSGYLGQLGYGDTNDVGDDELPVNQGSVDVGGSVERVTAGTEHTCAVLTTGAVRCWGNGFAGQLGYGRSIVSIGDNETPASVGDVNVGGTVQAIAAGNHTCALLTTGTVRCWGHGRHGRLGYGNTNNIGDNETPASAGDVNVGGVVTGISANGIHTCALLTTGRVRCWGHAGYGQLGYGNTNNVGDDEAPASVGDVQGY